MVNGDDLSGSEDRQRGPHPGLRLSGRLGAFQSNTIGSTVRSLGVAVENSTAAQSVIRDADFRHRDRQLTRKSDPGERVNQRSQPLRTSRRRLCSSSRLSPSL